MTTPQLALLPDHVLSAVLVLAKRQLEEKSATRVERLAFRSHDYELQAIFNDLRAEYSILAPFVFSDAGPEPYSPALNESVSRLQLSGLIGRENPDYEVVFTRPAADRFYDEVLRESLGKEQIQQLNEVASKFLDRISTLSS